MVTDTPTARAFARVRRRPGVCRERRDRRKERRRMRRTRVGRAGSRRRGEEEQDREREGLAMEDRTETLSHVNTPSLALNILLLRHL